MLYKYQFGFRKGVSTEDAVLNVVKYTFKGLDDGFSGVAGIFFNFSKAFHLVDHEIMLQKLNMMAFKVVSSYYLKIISLTGNGLYKLIGLQVLLVLFVPQGSSLGPLTGVKNVDLNFDQLFTFSDDMYLYYPFNFNLV